MIWGSRYFWKHPYPMYNSYLYSSWISTGGSLFFEGMRPWGSWTQHSVPASYWSINRFSWSSTGLATFNIISLSSYPVIHMYHVFSFPDFFLLNLSSFLVHPGCYNKYHTTSMWRVNWSAGNGACHSHCRSKWAKWETKSLGLQTECCCFMWFNLEIYGGWST